MERTRDARGTNGTEPDRDDGSSRRTRRRFLAAAGALGGAAVAGCLGGGDSTATDGGDDAAADGSATSSDEGSAMSDDGSVMGTATDGTGRTGTTATGSGGGGTDSSGTTADLPSWYGRELRDVTGDGTFTIGGFDRPVVLETFAVWCPVCTSQQEQLADLRSRRDDLVVVSLNVDPNESASKVRSHASDHGFDWRYAVAPADLTSTLVDEFGAAVTNAPSAPVIVACQDGSASLVDQRGVKSAGTLGGHVDGC
jgi:hypothetical protein